MDRTDKAYELMVKKKMNCSQTLVYSFCGEFGLNQNVALSLAQGFGGGMGHTGGVCGAVTGAYMVLGLACKAAASNARKNTNKTYALISDFNRRFTELHGSLNCTELIGYDLSFPEKLAEARENKVFRTLCPGFVRDSVKILETLLDLP